MVEKLKTQLTEKGQELNKFREEHNIRMRGEKEPETNNSTASQKNAGGVLVANNAESSK